MEKVGGAKPWKGMKQNGRQWEEEKNVEGEREREREREGERGKKRKNRLGDEEEAV